MFLASQPRLPLRRRLLSLAALSCSLFLGACGGGGETETEAGSTPSTPSTPAPASAADVSLLMMGNSHTVVADLPAQLAALLRAGLPGRSVSISIAPGYLFLDERIADTASMNLLRSRNWTAVVLQAQKYSSSGLFFYSTLEAERLVQAARSQAALPVMFPEWPRLGIAETQRIYELHVGIAQAQPACVPAIGQAWDLALQRHPGIRLHAGDGNHAELPGAYLTALMLYAAITGGSPRALPDIDNGVAPAVQAQLRAVAVDTLASLPARRHCPADAPLTGT